jgi:Ca2+/Na+ antiporter
MNMPVLALFIVLSFTVYIFYKIKQVRSKRPMEKKWLSSKANIALGLFVALFGINQLFIYGTALSYFVAAVFLLFGIGSAWAGFKMYKYVLPFAQREAEELD